MGRLIGLDRARGLAVFGMDAVHVVNHNQYRPDVSAVAAPVLDAGGSPLAAVAASMPDSRFDPSGTAGLGRMVVVAAAEITARYLG